MSNVVFKAYPYWPAENLEDVKDQLRLICSERKNDISQVSNLTNIFVGGRLVGKIPSGSADVTPEDKIGDINFTATFMYVLINNAGTATWRRATLASW